MKRKVTVALGPWQEHGLEGGSIVYKQVEVETKDDTNLYPIAVSIENNRMLPEGYKAPEEEKSWDASGTVINGHHIDSLVGKLLTYIDATYQDKDQREAQKKIARQTAWDWFNTHRESGEKTIKFAQTKV